MKKTIVYRNRAEIKILSIFMGGIWLLLYSYATINDLLISNSALLHNQKFLWTLAVVFALPIIIIARYKIEFDFEKRIITYTWYFLPQKTYYFDEVRAVTEVERNVFESLRYSFYVNDKRIFHFSEMDFQGQTKQSTDLLNEFLFGDGRFLYDIECSLKQAGYRFVVRNYALDEFIGTVHFSDHFRTDKNMCIRRISVSYDDKTEMFLLNVIETKHNRDDLSIKPEVRIICEMQVNKEELKETLLRLSNEYNNID